MKNDDWNSWSLYIIKTIESLQIRADDLEEEVNTINLELQTELTKLRVYSKVAAVLYGAISAILISVLSGFITYSLTNKPDIKDTQKDTQKVEQQKK